MALLRLLLLTSALFSIANATPSRATQTSETFLGANGKQYAVIRTVVDNLGSYYESETKTYLDEFSKETEKLVKSTLLVTSTTSMDVDDYSKVESLTTSNDQTLKLADVMALYNVTLTTKKAPAWSKRITWTNDGIRFDNSPHVQLVGPKEIAIFNQQVEVDGSFPHLISDLTVHQRCLYLTLSSKYEADSDADSTTSKVIYISEQKTKRLFNWITKKKTYLQAASFKSKQAAIQHASTLQQKVRDNKLYEPIIEVWSKQLENKQLAYVVLLTNSASSIQSKKIPYLNKTLNLRLKTIQSDHLRDRFPVEHKAP